MGGGMVCGEPYDYGFRYPSRVSGTPMYSSVSHPRRQSGFRGDEWFPEEVTNLARKRKLDGVKGEPLGAPNGTNVREIVVEDPSKSKISPTQGSQGYRDARTSCGISPPASPSVRGGSRSAAVGEGRTVTIPVVFSSEAAKEQPVPVVPQEGTKKPRRTCSDEAAAVMIQSVFRGYVLRKTKPLEHMRKISSIRTKLKDYERQLSDATLVEKMRSDVNVRLRVTEGIMTLLLQLDAIQGVHPDIRMWRKAVTKEVVTLQEKVDVLLKGGETLGTKPVYVEPTVEGHIEDTAMAVEDDSAVENQVNKIDDVVTEIVHRESLPECRDVEDNCADEIALDQLKLVDEEIVCRPDEMVVVQDTRDDIGARFRGASGVDGGDCAMRTEQNGGQEEAMQNGGLLTEGNDNVSQHTRLTSQVFNRNGAAGCETIDRTRLPMNDESETKPESFGKRDDAPRGEESVTLSTDMMGHTQESSNTPVEIEFFEDPEIEDTSTIAEQGMEVDREKSPPQNQVEELAGSRNEFGCSLNSSPSVHEKMKYFLKEISAPTGKARAGRVSHCARLNGAEEMDCHGAPGSSSDLEENDGAPVADLSLRTRDGKDDPGEGAETSGRTDNPQHDRILSKLCEENKMLKSLLVDVMKWNQLQANQMRNVTERLGKVEDRLMAKQKKGTRKPQGQRCTRSRLERRLRR